MLIGHHSTGDRLGQHHFEGRRRQHRADLLLRRRRPEAAEDLLSLQPRPDGVTLKDTFVNIRDSGELVTNLGHAATGPRSASIGFRVDPDVDEFEAVGVERANCEVVRAPRIKGAPIALECVVDRIFAVGDLNNHVVWANVVRFHVRDGVLLENGRVDIGAPYR